MKIDSKTGISYPYDKEYYFSIRLPISICGGFICGYKDHSNCNYSSKMIHNYTEMDFFVNKMWAHKPHKKTGS